MLFPLVSFAMTARRLLFALASVSCSFLGFGMPLTAQVYSPVVGYLRFDCPADSDTSVSVPFHQSPRWAGRLLSAPADQGGGVARLSLKGSPSFAAGELTDTAHFLLCRDPAGPEGRHFRIVAHGAGHVDVDAAVGDLAGLGEDGLVSVIPAWTLGLLFPPGAQTTFHPSSGRLAPQRGSELLLFDETRAGTDLAPERRFFVTSAGWFEVGSFEPADGVVIEPGRAFLVRNPPGVAPTSFLAHDQVYVGVVSLPLRVSASKAVDTVLAPPRPVVVKLEDLDFAAEGFKESPSTASGDRRDQLLVYDNATAERNKRPDAVYFRSGGSWLREADGFPVSNAVEIEPSAALVVRKAPGSSDGFVRWVNAPTYDVTAP
jgi:uncharacterized protein (TIGR02597 family)